MTYEYEKASTHDRLKYALAVMSGRVTHPTVEACFVLGFGPNDLRQLSVGGEPQPPHIDVIRARCEQILYEVIIK